MKKIHLFSKIKWPLIFIAFFAVVWFFFIREKNMTVMVRRTSLQNRVVVRSLTASGVIISNSEANLSFQTSGKIARVYVKKGDNVNRGRLIASLDVNTQLQTIDGLKNAMEALIREKDIFESQMYKNKKALGGQTQYDLKLREYKDNIDQAKANYNAAILGTGNMSIYAPFTGTIIDLTKESGETAVLGETFITLADLNSLKFKADIDQEDYGLLKKGQEAKVKLDSYGGQEFLGKVTALQLFASNDTSNFEADIVTETIIEKPFRMGMLGDAYIILDQSTKEVPSLTVDEVSYDEAEHPYVWVVENGKIKKQPIEVGLDGDIYLEVKTPISQMVVISAKDGQKMIEGYNAKIIN